MRMRGVLIMLALAGGWTWGCRREATTTDEARWATLRDEMVTTQIAARGVRDANVLAALRAVPRHLFVPAELCAEAYADHPLPIGEGQTISQPYIVGLMTELLGVKPGDKVLEVGTGSGYQAAVLAAMGCEVYTIEIRPALAAGGREAARATGRQARARAGRRRVRRLAGGGAVRRRDRRRPLRSTSRSRSSTSSRTAAHGDPGRLVLPAAQGDHAPRRERIPERDVIPVRFVPMTGEVERRP